MSETVHGGLWDTRPNACPIQGVSRDGLKGRPRTPHPRRVALRAICGHLQALAHAPQTLPPSMAMPIRTVDIAPVLDAVRAATPSPPGVAVLSSLQSHAVAPGVAVRAGLAFAELYRNALIHAFQAGGPGHVGIHLWPVHRLPGVEAMILVSDDGCGFGAEPPPGSGCGISIAHRLVRRCGGTLARSACQGTVWYLALPSTASATHAGFCARLARQPFNPGLRRLQPH